MSAHPVLFTVAFRKKLAELTAEQRREWLSSLARAAREGKDEEGSVRAQELREVARGSRIAMVEAIARNLGPFRDELLSALREVPRERFVRPVDIERSVEDIPLPLDDEGLATVSAPHAYALTYRLLHLTEGDRLVELGTGSGYGAAIAAFVVGSEGSVSTFEIDPALAAWAKRTLAGEPNVRVTGLDAVESAPEWGDAPKVAVTFAVTRFPRAWLEALPERGLLVAPVGAPDRDQRLVLVTKRRGRAVETDHGAVRYVRNRSTK